MIKNLKIGDRVWCINYIPQAQSIKIAEYEAIQSNGGVLMLTRTIVNTKRGKMKIFPRAFVPKDCFKSKEELLENLSASALPLLL